MAINLNADNFDQEVINSNIPVLVDFWAAWCSPCRMLVPIIDDISIKYAGKLKVCKLNVDEASDLAAKYAVMSIPMLILFDKGKLVKQTVGVMSKENLAEWIDGYLKKG
ncbi:MAG: thioredoxin [Candidatus Omnitrophica bacterium]|nr:thioredoxin [Candidatus Omnitrophota bacterium]MBU1924369.1 thioredoxin [Candidatus Omnitrophota bacterium]